ncbi:mannose-6-phosphate isomerase [Elysia marginata]|uniref:mannose-6-phosphate isomerase n=1 Tax=Elysia marginata TaxID=1093978 RepID=A0AAV4EAP8_9GAST|nr:mannose-6-phosphate isomerase [Elysia marginata]
MCYESCILFIPPVLQLRCAVAHNTWGKLGDTSLVCRLKSQADSTFQVDRSKHYAQLWLGDHCSHETSVLLPGRDEQTTQKTMRLRDWLELHPEQQGIPAENCLDKENRCLPFLLKVLSISSPLALQVHPDKETAEWLHSQEPEVFDANHKPEMAIALTPFTAMVGFRPVKQVASFLADVEEFKEAIGVEISQLLNEVSDSNRKGGDCDKKLETKALQAVFFRLVKTKNITVERALQKLVNRIKKDQSLLDVPEYKAILEMDAEFPGDTGALTVFLLNLVQLEPGQAVYIDVWIPHAYISGDCIEIQASSDNVLRAAFTNKRRDVDLMCRKMAFVSLPKHRFMVAPVVKHMPTTVATIYPSACNEFAIEKYQGKQSSSRAYIPALPVASICIVIQGEGQVNWFQSYDTTNHNAANTDSMETARNGFHDETEDGVESISGCTVDYNGDRDNIASHFSTFEKDSDLSMHLLKNGLCSVNSCNKGILLDKKGLEYARNSLENGATSDKNYDIDATNGAYTETTHIITTLSTNSHVISSKTNSTNGYYNDIDIGVHIKNNDNYTKINDANDAVSDNPGIETSTSDMFPHILAISRNSTEVKKCVVSNKVMNTTFALDNVLTDEKPGCSEYPVNHSSGSGQRSNASSYYSYDKEHCIFNNGTEINGGSSKVDGSPTMMKNRSTTSIQFRAGTALFVAAGICLEISTRDEKGEGGVDDLVIYRASSGHC